MVSSTQDAQRTSRKDVALSFCVLEPVSIEKNAVFIGWQGMTKTFCQHCLPSFCATLYCTSCNNCSYTLEALLAAALLIDMSASSVTVPLSISSVTAVG